MENEIVAAGAAGVAGRIPQSDEGILSEGRKHSSGMSKRAQLVTAGLLVVFVSAASWRSASSMLAVPLALNLGRTFAVDRSVKGHVVVAVDWTDPLGEQQRSRSGKPFAA
jgi:hypothetical protein